jgi:hypothetical protein
MNTKGHPFRRTENDIRIGVVERIASYTKSISALRHLHDHQRRAGSEAVVKDGATRRFVIEI